MRLKVGSYAYKVVVCRDLTDTDGKPAVGHCSWRDRVISLDQSLDEQQRRVTLKHEFFHAFEYAFGAARGEDAADFAATVSDELDRQIEALGGWRTLDRLFEHEPSRVEPIESAPGIAIDLRPMTATRFDCRRCGAPTLVADVQQAPHMFDRELFAYTMERWFECHTCGAENRWTEYTTESGAPTGEGVPTRGATVGVS